jgi:hypothetical protein
MITPYRSRYLIATLLVAAVWAGCRETEDPVDEERNRAPETYLVQSPAFNDAGYYLSHLFWDGYDPDGRVAFYEVAVTDSAGILETAVWHPTFRSDSLVRFGVGGPTGTSQILHHRFFVRAVDNLGRRDLEPAWILFQAKDFFQPLAAFTVAEGSRPGWPETIQLGPSASCISGFPPDTLPVGADVRFEWQGVDHDSLLGQEVGSVTAFRYKLVPVDADFRGGTLADTAASYEDLPAGTYSFVVRPVDDASWTGESCRYFHVNFDPRLAIERPVHPTEGPMKAFRISGVRIVDNGDICAVPVPTEPWTSEGLPPPPERPELPGWVLASDTLGMGERTDTGWYIQFDVETDDPDGSITGIEVNLGTCTPAYVPWAPPGEEEEEPQLNCSAVAWECLQRLVSIDAGTALVGPLTSGDWQIAVAAIDDQGQRGIAGSDTLIVHVDRAPYLALDRPGIETSACDDLGGIPGDTIQVCGNDTLYVVTQVQGSGSGTVTTSTPCATATAYAGTGGAAPLTVYDYQAFPQPGDRIELAFEPLPQDTTRRLARLGCLYWARDPDGAGWVTAARWDVDEPPTIIQGWEPVIRTGGVAGDQFTPMCFEVPIVQDDDEGEHVLYLEIRDWLQDVVEGDEDVAERTTRYAIPFTTVDISGRRTALAGEAKP